MEEEYSKDSINGNGKKESNTNPYGKLPNGNDEYQEGYGPIQERYEYEVTGDKFEINPNRSIMKVLSDEKVPHHASDYSLFRSDDEDVYEGTLKSLDSTSLEFDTFVLPSSEIQQTEDTATQVRKKAKRRIIISVGLLAVVLIAILAAVGFTLLYISLIEKEIVMSTTNSTFAEFSSEQRNTSVPKINESLNLNRSNAQ
uniref:Uncharacterized protein n=1 Tax=Plectus sambesii TaxID=2011161 RepID=A0A914XLL8_9BILA